MSTNAKIPINLTVEVLKRNVADPAILRQIVEELQYIAANDAADDEEKQPAVKKQFCIIVSDPEGRITGDFAGWVVQIEEGGSVATLVDRICRAAYEFNASKRGRLLPAKTVGEALECVPSRFFKDSGVWVKTREPILLVKTNNEIPRE